jgi:hypothetical protein
VSADAPPSTRCQLSRARTRRTVTIRPAAGRAATADSSPSAGCASRAPGPARPRSVPVGVRRRHEARCPVRQPVEGEDLLVVAEARHGVAGVRAAREVPAQRAERRLTGAAVPYDAGGLLLVPPKRWSAMCSLEGKQRKRGLGHLCPLRDLRDGDLPKPRSRKSATAVSESVRSVRCFSRAPRPCASAMTGACRDGATEAEKWPGSSRVGVAARGRRPQLAAEPHGHGNGAAASRAAAVRRAEFNRVPAFAR